MAKNLHGPELKINNFKFLIELRITQFSGKFSLFEFVKKKMPVVGDNWQTRVGCVVLWASDLHHLIGFVLVNEVAIETITTAIVHHDPRCLVPVRTDAELQVAERQEIQKSKKAAVLGVELENPLLANGLAACVLGLAEDGVKAGWRFAERALVGEEAEQAPCLLEPSHDPFVACKVVRAQRLEVKLSEFENSIAQFVHL